MRNKAIRYFFSLLILLSGTFAVAPMAFCTMKAEAPSCCPPAAKQPKAQCPICVSELSQHTPLATLPVNQVNGADQLFVSLLPVCALADIPQPKILDYSVVHFYDSSPPRYIEFCNFRL